MSEFILDKLGSLTGYLTIGLFVLLALRYILKAYFKKFGKTLDPKSAWYKFLVITMGANKTYHPWLGYLTIVTMVVHVYIQTGFKIRFYPSQVTGMVAAGLMVANILSGFIGEKVLKKPRPKWWLWTHRILTILIGIAILIHI